MSKRIERRRVKRAALWLCRAVGLFALSRWITRRAVRLLCYHGTWRTDDGFTGDAMFIRPATFALRLDTLARLGFDVVPLDVAIRELAAGITPPRLRAVITIDDGWFGTYADMLPALESRQFPATLYVDTAHLEFGGPIPHVFARYLRRVLRPAESHTGECAFARATDPTMPLAQRLDALQQYAREVGVDISQYIARRSFVYMTPAELRDASARGLDIQLHTHNHTMHDFSQEQIDREVTLNRRAIEMLLGGSPRPLKHFCYPSGVTHGMAAEHLRSCGIVSATTTDPGLAWPGTDPFNLPRYLDGDNVSEVEFEAQVSGFVHLARASLRAMGR